jgi:DNA-binding XRE family transcriptional regulator
MTTQQPVGAPPVRLEEWIKDQRGRLGYSQAKLARLLETTEKNVGNWESGRNLGAVNLSSEDFDHPSSLPSLTIVVVLPISAWLA